MKKPGFLMLLAVVLLVSTGADVIDRIAAVVNDDIILLSEVEEKLFILQAQGQLKNTDSTQVAEVRREILDRLIEEKLVVDRAESQGIEISEDQVLARVDEALKKVRERFPTLEAFRKALADEGITETMLRDRYVTDIRQEMLGQRIVGQEVRSKVQITSDDVRKHYEENKDELPVKPEEIHLAHIVSYPVSEAMEEEAKERVLAARERILNGESFESVAKEVSNDPTAAGGGKLGWFSPGDLDPDFEAAVDSMEVGDLSGPVRTRFGYHIIQLLGREGKRFEVSHILAMVDPGPEDVERARKRTEAALERVRNGEDFAEVAREMSEDELSRDEGGDLGWTPVQYLLPDVAAVLDTVAVGSVSPVVESDRGFHVFKVLNRRAGGAYDFDEIKDQLRTYLEQKKLEEVYDEWLAAVRDSAYVEIKAWQR